jgi:radical SAM superfamily enzyme YgiQ (UPF0313 family)
MLIVLAQIFDRGQEIQSQYPVLGLGYLAAFARLYLKDLEFVCLDDVEDIVAAQPDLVGVTVVSENYHLAREFATELKKALDVPLVLGGVHVSMLPDTMTADFDVGVIGEGEQTFVELLRHIRERGKGWKEGLDAIDGLCFHSNGRLVLTKQRELIAPLDNIPHPDRELLSSVAGNASERDTYSMFSARGCPYNCNFCSSTNFWRRTRYFSAEYIIEEIRELKERFGARGIFFWDDLFVVNKQRLYDMERILRETGLGEGMSFMCNLRSDVVDEDLCKTLKSMNVYAVSMGLESGSDRVLKLMNKRTTSAQHEEALRLLKDFGILVGGSFIIGYPGETRSDMEKTIEFVQKHLGAALRSFDVYPFILYPGTKSWVEASESGMLDSIAEPYRFKVEEYSLNPDNYLHANAAAGAHEILMMYLYLKGLSYKNSMNINRDLASDRMKDFLELEQHHDALKQHYDVLRLYCEALRQNYEELS